MNLSEQTVSILKNFSSINQNLLVKQGKVINTMSAMKNIVAKAEVEEEFPVEFAIYDLNEFLSCLSIFAKPELTFEDGFVIINRQSNSGEVIITEKGNNEFDRLTRLAGLPPLSELEPLVGQSNECPSNKSSYNQNTN